jgi:biofilm PGA synthesis N-glycosyltransferase PgaC
MISVIVPCLNEEPQIVDFLISLNDQTYPGFELIVVDGGSTDRSRILVDFFRSEFQITGVINEKRNLGFIRNFGAEKSKGNLLLFSNSDAVFPRDFLEKIIDQFSDPRLLALTGRTIPLNAGSLTRASYFAFDKLRQFFSRLGKFSPSGNFLAITREAFFDIGGFPEDPVNEDAGLGERIERYARIKNLKFRFDQNIAAAHRVKKKRSGWKTLLFYFYVLGNFSSDVKKLLSPLARKRAREFNKK